MTDKLNRTIGRSFRIDVRWLNMVNEEADREGVSPNALVNKILQEYSQYNRFFKRFGVVALTQKSFSRIVEACPKEDLVDIAKKAGSTVAKDLFRTLGLKHNNRDVTFFVVKILTEYANWYQCEHHVTGGNEYFHLRHNLGEKWSIYVAEMIGVLFEDCCNRKVKKDFLEGAVTLELSLT